MKLWFAPDPRRPRTGSRLARARSRFARRRTRAALRGADVPRIVRRLDRLEGGR